MLDKNSFKSGISHSYPICIAFLFMYSALGMLGHARGIDLIEMVVMSATIFAVPLQALVIDSAGASIFAVIVNAFILNFKFLLMTSVLIPLWKKKLLTIPSLHFICGSTYMVCAVEKDVEEPWSFFLGVSIPSYITAIFATALGHKLWQIGGNYQPFLHALSHIVVPIHLICLTLKRKKEPFSILATCIGIIITPILSIAMMGKFSTIAWFIIAGLIVSLEDKICGKQSLQPA